MGFWTAQNGRQEILGAGSLVWWDFSKGVLGMLLRGDFVAVCGLEGTISDQRRLFIAQYVAFETGKKKNKRHGMR